MFLMSWITGNNFEEQGSLFAKVIIWAKTPPSYFACVALCFLCSFFISISLRYLLLSFFLSSNFLLGLTMGCHSQNVAARRTVILCRS